MIVLICVIAGLLMRIASGRSVSGLADSHIRAEGALLFLLVVQMLIPALQLTGIGGRIAYFGFLATFPCIIGIAWVNRRSPGLLLLGIGLLMNMVVIASNGGMPVFQAAVSVARPGATPLAIPATDFIHVLGTAGSRLPWLGDVIPLPGPPWIRSVSSAGDCLLFVGVMVFIAATERTRSVNAANHE